MQIPFHQNALLMSGMLILSLTINAQIPKHQRLAFPDMEFSLTKSNPTFSEKAYCLDGDILVDGGGSLKYLEVLSSPANAEVFIGSAAAISLQEAFRRKLLRTRVAGDLTVTFEKLTPENVRVKFYRYVALGTEPISKDLSIASLPIASGEIYYRIQQEEIWRERLLQKLGFKTSPVDGIGSGNENSIKQLVRSLGYDPAEDGITYIAETGLLIWEESSEQRKVVAYLRSHYPDQTADDFASFFKLLKKFSDDSKFGLDQLRKTKGGIIKDFLYDTYYIKTAVNGEINGLYPCKAGENWQLLYGDEILTISQNNTGGYFRVLDREQVSLKKIQEIQAAKKEQLSRASELEDYNYLYFETAEGSELRFFLNGRNYSLTLPDGLPPGKLYEQIRTASAGNWKNDKSLLLVGDCWQNNLYASGMDMAEISRELSLQSPGHDVFFIPDLSAWLDITPDNQQLKRSFLDFQNLPQSSLPDGFTLADLRFGTDRAQVVMVRHKYQPRVWTFSGQVDITGTRQAVKDYAAGLISIGELTERTKDYVNMMEQFVKENYPMNIVTAEEGELDMARLWALHKKPDYIRWIRDDRDYAGAMARAAQKVITVPQATCILVSRPVSDPLRHQLDSLKILGIRIVYNDSLEAFRKVMDNTALKQIIWLTAWENGSFVFKERTCTVVELTDILKEGMQKDYIHIISNGSRDLADRFAGTARFTRVIYTEYIPQDSVSFDRATGIIMECFRRFIQGNAYLDAFLVDFFGKGSADYKRILGTNFVKTADGRYRIRLKNITPVQWKALEKAKLKEEVMSKSVWPQNKDSRINWEIDQIIEEIGREHIRNFKVDLDKNNYLLGIPGLKVWIRRMNAEILGNKAA